MSNASRHFRSTLFNLLFYGGNAIACIACLPGLLMPRRGLFFIIHTYVRFIYFIEKHIAGLDYEVRGMENLPEKGSYIVAAKHQSPYETFKLHLLFDDPAIILKQELLRIPLWGWFLARIHPIAIDRSQGKEAIKQIIEGGERVKKEGRPIIIFPQGTRVYPWQTAVDKPYKIGAARLYEATGLPVIPLALNSGMFWPRKSWIKKPGKVVFEFLEPIEPGKDMQETANLIQQRIEQATHALQDEAKEQYGYSADKPAITPGQKKASKKTRRLAFLSLLALIFIYCGGWFGLQHHLQQSVDNYIAEANNRGLYFTGDPPKITGFPGLPVLFYSGEIHHNPLNIRLGVPGLYVRGLMPPVKTLAFSMPYGISLLSSDRPSVWSLDRLEVSAPLPDTIPADYTREGLSAWRDKNGRIVLDNLIMKKSTLTITAAGQLTLDENLQPAGNLDATMTGYMAFIEELENYRLINTKEKLLAISLLTGLSQTDEDGGNYIDIDITLQNRKLFVGPLQLASLPAIRWAWRSQPARP